MKKINTNLILIISIILLMLFTLSFIYLLNIIKNKNNHISAVSITLGRKIVEKDNLNILEEKMSELVNTQKSISNFLVDTSNIDKFVVYLESMGTDNNLDLSVKSVDFVKNDKNKMLVSISTKGNFSDTMKTLLTLENAPYNVTINSFYLNKEVAATSSTIQETVGSISKGKILPQAAKTIWQMDISFSILSQ